jgi:LysM repeat protein
MKKVVLLATAALLLPSALATAQEDKLPTAETRGAEPSLTPTGPDVPKAVRSYVDDVRKQLETPPTPDKAGEKPAAKKGAEKGGAVSVQRELLWEEDLDEYNRRRRLRQAAPTARLEGGVSDVHVVQPGDTLWDLSAKYLNSPWVWPRVWSYNPHVTNPHWIYPGQVIRFRPLVAAAAAPIEPDIVPKKERIVPGHAGIVAFRHVAFLTKEEVARAGKIQNSPNDQSLLSRYSTAYVTFAKPKEVKAGDKFLSVRVQEEIEHPATGKKVGTLVIVTGELEVTALAPDDKFHTATLRRSWRTVERGNLLIPYQELQVKVERRPNTKDLKGYIVAMVDERLVGKYQLAFVDLGQKHGAEFGNLLRLVRRGDGYLRESEFEDDLKKMPLEETGELLVLEAKPDFSTCVVLRTLFEGKVGDKVILRKGE